MRSRGEVCAAADVILVAGLLECLRIYLAEVF
jgi:hypothetical protein